MFFIEKCKYNTLTVYKKRHKFKYYIFTDITTYEIEIFCIYSYSYYNLQHTVVKI